MSNENAIPRFAMHNVIELTQIVHPKNSVTFPDKILRFFLTFNNILKFFVFLCRFGNS